MPRALGTLSQARETVQYYQNILDSPGLIGYWMLDERYGTVTYDQVMMHQLGVQNGAYTGVTLGQPGIGDGNTSPFFDGVNDFSNIFTLALAGRFDGTEGSIMAWARVFNAGVWADGVNRDVILAQADGNNQVFIRKEAVPANRFRLYRRAGGVLQFHTIDGITSTDWEQWTMTWSELANQFIAYRNGVAIAPPVVANAWVGNIVTAIIGASSVVPVSPWHGYIAHVAIWDRPLAQDEILGLAEV